MKGLSIENRQDAPGGEGGEEQTDDRQRDKYDIANRHNRQGLVMVAVAENPSAADGNQSDGAKGKHGAQRYDKGRYSRGDKQDAVNGAEDKCHKDGQQSGRYRIQQAKHWRALCHKVHKRERGNAQNRADRQIKLARNHQIGYADGYYAFGGDVA